MKRMLSGIKPTGQLHLGNYIGALRHFVDYQDEYEMFAFIANLHCITVPQDPAELQKNLKDCVALYLACGLDPSKATIFLQTDVPQHAQL
ncbi:MAG: tryptophan--tRNA ligase, partial [Solobacterium sp.]|nr:tryptophan--tRNA ligase [Solobacterium sp.]